MIVEKQWFESATLWVNILSVVAVAVAMSLQLADKLQLTSQEIAIGTHPPRGDQRHHSSGEHKQADLRISGCKSAPSPAAYVQAVAVAMQSGMRFCPIHEYEIYACDADCRTRHARFKKLAHALNVLWHDRTVRGVGYVSLAAQWRCAACMHLFKPWRRNQRFCSVECRRKHQWARRYNRLRRIAA